MTRVASAWSSRIRTQPIRVAPLPGEALDSWLEAYAARCHTPWGDFLDIVGLRNRPRGRSRYPMDAPSLDLAALSTATGVEIALLQTMLPGGSGLQGSDGEALSRDVMLPGSRFCPACLAGNDGRWMLWWRLRWAFACPTHRYLLADVCPHCQRAPRTYAVPLEGVPVPGQCAHPAAHGTGRRPPRCGTDLSTTRTPRLPQAHPALAAQQSILAIVTAASATTGVYRDAPVSAAQYLRDLTAGGMRALRYGSATDLRAASSAGGNARNPLAETAAQAAAQRLHSAIPSPPTAAQTAVAACAAVPVLAADSVHAAAARIQWLITPSRTQGLAVTPTTLAWAHGTSDTFTGVQLAALTPHLAHAYQVRHRCHSPRPRRAPRCVPPVHRWLPALFWYRWALPVADTPVGFEQLRLGLSAAVALAAGHLHLDRACRSLDSVTTAKQASRVLQALAARPDWPATAVMLGEMADLLSAHPAPIDYARRRHLPVDNLLPEAQWHSICRAVGVNPGSGPRGRVFRCWLYERITGSPGRVCSDALDTSEFRSFVADVPRVLHPALVAALDDAARQFLDDHGLGDEPLRWTPPQEALPDWTHRRPPGTTIDVAAVHRQVRRGDGPLGAVAARLDTSIELVRETLNDHPAPRPAMTPGQRRAAGAVMADARAHLTRDEFTELYLGQQLSLHAIGRKVGASRQTVTRLAREYGIELRPSTVGRPPGPPR